MPLYFPQRASPLNMEQNKVSSSEQLQLGQMTRQDDSLNLFRNTPWCAALLDDPNLAPFEPRYRGSFRSHNTRDTFMGATLAAPETIRDHVILCPTQPTTTVYPRMPEALTIFSLGTMLMGHANVAHGGLVATLLDEVMGVIININEQVEKEQDPTYRRKAIMTLKLDITYRKPVPAPGLILARAAIHKAEGRKRFVKASLEDGHGDILAEADALFLELKRRPVVPQSKI